MCTCGSFDVDIEQLKEFKFPSESKDNFGWPIGLTPTKKKVSLQKRCRFCREMPNFLPVRRLPNHLHPHCNLEYFYSLKRPDFSHVFKQLRNGISLYDDYPEEWTVRDMLIDFPLHEVRDQHCTPNLYFVDGDVVHVCRTCTLRKLQNIIVRERRVEAYIKEWAHSYERCKIAILNWISLVNN